MKIAYSVFLSGNILLKEWQQIWTSPTMSRKISTQNTKVRWKDLSFPLKKTTSQICDTPAIGKRITVNAFSISFINYFTCFSVLFTIYLVFSKTPVRITNLFLGREIIIIVEKKSKYLWYDFQNKFLWYLLCSLFFLFTLLFWL